MTFGGQLLLHNPVTPQLLADCSLMSNGLYVLGILSLRLDTETHIEATRRSSPIAAPD